MGRSLQWMMSHISARLVEGTDVNVSFRLQNYSFTVRRLGWHYLNIQIIKKMGMKMGINQYFVYVSVKYTILHTLKTP